MATETKTANKKSTWLVKYYLFTWLGLGAITLLWHLAVRPNYIKPATSLVAGLANLFGPWATIIVQISDFPNAGGGFRLQFTLICTTFLAAVIVLPFVIRKRWLQILCAILFVPVIIGWFCYGWLQLASCAT